MMTHTFNPSAQEVESGGLEVQVQPRLYIEFQANVDNKRLCHKKKLFLAQGQESCLIQEVSR